MTRHLTVPALEIQVSPNIVIASIPGHWLLKHSTPSWRLADPQLGFQRVVREERAQAIAVAVLDQGRTFPNTIVLATDKVNLRVRDGALSLPGNTKFLVVDGQHRLWAQKFATYEAHYGCVIHTGLSEVEMARLFLEINDNQRRVPASLRWDLVRLVRPEDDPHSIEAVELVYELVSDQRSPLYQRIDLTGEQGEIELKQGSIAPELKSFVANKKQGIRDLDFEKHYEALLRAFSGIRAVDPDGWRSGSTPLIKARVIRALIRAIPDIADRQGSPPHRIAVSTYKVYFGQIDLESLSADNLRAVQGSAGISAIYDLVASQMGVGEPS